MVPMGIALAVVYWFIDASVDSIVLHQGTLAERILPSDAGEILLRLVVGLLIILFGIYSHSMIVKSRRMESHHKREHNFITSVLDTADALVVVLDATGRIVGINNSCEKTMGYAPEDVKGELFWQLFPVDEEKDRVRQIFSELHQVMPTHRLENYWRTKEGGLRMISWSTAALRDDNGSVEYIIATGMDITERQRLEHERRNMLSMFAHDMRSPVITAGGYLSRLLAGKAGQIGEEQMEYLQIMQEEIALLERLITDFLEFSQFEAMENRPILSPVSVKNVVYKNIEVAKMEAARKSITILLDIPGIIPDEINTDPVLIDRVISNLLDNAMKYSKAGGSVTVRLSDIGKDILVQVTDSGIGIPEKHIPHIFDAFYRVDRNIKGTGLGLSIVKKIVEAHGGKIWVESIPGKGSTFNFTLPKSGSGS